MILTQPLDNLELDNMVARKQRMLDALVDFPLGAKREGAEANVVQIDLIPREDEYPDGGAAAWGVVLGATCATFATLGVLSTWGAFQTYYQRDLLPGTKPSAIALIGSTQFALVFLPGLVAGRLCDLGHYQRTLFVASVTLVMATAATGQCKGFWQLLICQGLFTGLSCGMIFTPIPTILSHWFNKRRLMAFGISAAGSSVGGVVMPIACSHLIQLIGHKWTMRVLAFVVFSLLAVANLTLKLRFDPPRLPGPFFIWSDFRMPAFNVYIVGCAVNLLGLYTLLTYVSLSAIEVGISPGFSFFLVSIANAAGGFGQIVAGGLSDKHGAINVTVPLTLLCGIITHTWPYATTRGSFIIVAIIYGFCAGAVVSLIPAPLVVMGDIRDAGRRTGIAWFVIALGAASGPPISGVISRNSGDFKSTGYYAGTCIIAASVFQCATKYLMHGTLRGKC